MVHSDKLRVLIADDEAPARRRLRDVLADCADRLPVDIVGEADNGLDALNQVQQQPVDAVLLDIRMPGMDGLEALPRILGLKEGLPVIMNTAYSQYQESFMSWAADAYVVKSSDLSELKQKIKELL